MLRWLTIIGSTALILAVILVARYDKLHDTEGKGYDIECTQSSDPAAAAGSLICTAEHSQKAQSGESSSPWWHVFFAWPEGVTALLIAFTLCAIIWQAWETRKAAEATKESATAALKSVKLQEAQLKQWVELDEWDGRSEHFFPKATRTTYWMTFWVTNPTKMPLTLKKVYITVPDGRPVLLSEDDSVIAPENGHRIKWPTVIADETMKRLVEGRWEFTLIVDVDFVDVFGDPKHSQFTVACKCRSTNCEVNEYHTRHTT
jgi:hypothetical protein